MSFTGSGARIWKLTERAAGRARWFLLPLVVVLVVAAWVVVLAWYCVFGVLVVPYRLIRRGSRKRRRDELRHREVLAAVERQRRLS